MRELQPSSPDIFAAAQIEQERESLLEKFFPLMQQSPEGLYCSSPKFEVESPIGEKARQELVAGVMSLPENKGRQLWELSKDLKYISDNEASHRALDRVYSGPIAPDNLPNRQLSRLFLENLHNAMAARNRFRIVSREFSNAIMSRMALGQSDNIHVLSIAAGSSRAILETTAAFPPDIRSRIKVRLMDASKNALYDGKLLAEKLGILDQVELKQAHFLASNRYLEERYRPDFVEVVGLNDYLNDETSTALMRMINTRMAAGGRILLSNVSPNDEQDFLHNIIGWREMEYREGEELVRLAQDAGFSSPNIQLLQEPLGFCHLISAEKN